jgi:hypothetical protein
MSYDAAVTMRKGEIRVLYGEATAETGDTLTISNSPAPTYTLYDHTGAIVAGPTATTNYDTAAALTVQCWFIFSTASLTVGTYLLVFTFKATSTLDAMARTYLSTVQVLVEAVAQDLFTYDPATDAGTVRMLIADTDSTNYRFNDVEIARFLALRPASVYSAASLAAFTWAMAQGEQAAELRASDGTSVKRRPLSELVALSKELANQVNSGELVTDTIKVSDLNDLLDSYRPTWRDVNDLPVVE